MTVLYRLTASDNFIIEYCATCDKATPINLTNHTYWNISGDLQYDLLTHRLLLSCSHYLPVDETQIPTGEVRSVANSPFDLTQGSAGPMLLDVIPKVDGGGQCGLDHCFVVSADSPVVVSSRYAELGNDRNHVLRTVELRHVATLTSPGNGESVRKLMTYSTKPAVQIYTGNFLPVLNNPSDSPHRQHNAICIETQYYVDGINIVDKWKTTEGLMNCSGHTGNDGYNGVVLRPGVEYYHQTMYCFRTG